MGGHWERRTWQPIHLVHPSRVLAHIGHAARLREVRVWRDKEGDGAEGGRVIDVVGRWGGDAEDGWQHEPR